MLNAESQRRGEIAGGNAGEGEMLPLDGAVEGEAVSTGELFSGTKPISGGSGGADGGSGPKASQLLLPRPRAHSTGVTGWYRSWKVCTKAAKALGSSLLRTII